MDKLKIDGYGTGGEPSYGVGGADRTSEHTDYPDWQGDGVGYGFQHDSHFGNGFGHGEGDEWGDGEATGNDNPSER